MRKWERYWEKVPSMFMLNELQRAHPIRNLMAEEAKIGNDVLDVACGQCISYSFFRMAGIKYVGIDITKKFIDSSRKVYPEIETYEASALDIPFPDASFDTVCCKDLLEHLAPEDVSTAIMEMWRVARLKLMIAFFLPPWDKQPAISLIDGLHGTYYQNQYNERDILTVIEDLEDVGGIDIQWIRSDAAIKIRPPPGEKPYTHAPLYIITKNSPDLHPSV